MEDKNKKITYAVILVAVLALVLVNVWQPGEWSFRDRTDYDEQERIAREELAQYQALLAALEPNYEASQQMLEKIATEDLVRKEVNETLQVGQRIEIPQLADSEIKTNPRSDKDYVANYFIKTQSMFDNFVNEAKPQSQNLFADTTSFLDLSRAERTANDLVDNLKAMEVPAETANLHKAIIVAYDQYADIFSEAKKYDSSSSSNPWPTVYNKYAVIDNRMAVVKSEAENLNNKYSLSPSGPLPEFSLVKTANAQFGFVTVGVDWQMILYEGIRTGLARAFAQFSVQMIDKLVAHIEKNFAIASQLYYSNELGRYYSVEYMKKFVKDPLDQDIIQKFLPEYFCVNSNPKDLKKIFTAKAASNAGEDIIINPGDPDFVQKLARLGGDEKNYPLWWEGYYESLAAQTKSEAQSAATKEVISPGVKTGRDIISGQVNKTVSAIFSVQESAINGAMNLGTNNAENVASQLVAGIVQNLVNKFVFTPISGGASASGGIGVIKEKNVCLQVQQIKPLIPIPGTDYQTPDGQTSTTPVNTTPPFNPR